MPPPGLECLLVTTSSGTTHTVLLEPDESTDDRCKMSYFTTHGAGCDGEGINPRPLRQTATRPVHRLRLDPDHLTLLQDDGTELGRIHLQVAARRPSPDTVRRFNDQCQ